MRKNLQILNLLSLLLAIAAGYLVNSKYFGHASMAEMSAKYNTLLTPAGYAFGIWGLIYLSLLAFCFYQFSAAAARDSNYPDMLDRVKGWFLAANLANTAWVFLFSQGQISLSLLLMIIIFFSLLKIVLNLNMERWDAPLPVIAFSWWPFSFYFGWINVALVANIAVWLRYLGWNGGRIAPETWAISILVVATAIFITMIWKRNMREYGTVTAWGIAGIAVKNWEIHPAVAWTAALAAALILLNSGLHGYINRATAPFGRRSKPSGL